MGHVSIFWRQQAAVNQTSSFSSLRRWLRTLKRTLLGLLVVGLSLLAAAVFFESRSSWLQARELSRYATALRYEMLPGASDAIRFPAHGPFDRRMGYADLPRYAARLTERGFVVARQARFSPALMDYAGNGYFPPYREKTHAGLQAVDYRGEPLYGFRYPQRGYARFEDIPPRVFESLLFIENRGLLDPERPTLNPAVDWSRFGQAALAQVIKLVDDDLETPGGSTLATQIEKYRHSPDGVTYSAREKLRQMVSASVRAYREDSTTLAAREALVLDYLNTVPLSAAPVYGEVHGLGDGLWVWYGADFERVNRLLAAPEGEGEVLAQQGEALRQVLSLMVAHRRPSYYLGRGGRDDLRRLTDSHVRVLAEAGLIGPALRDAALTATPVFRDQVAAPAWLPAEADKGATAIRARLAGLLGTSLYELDRLDLHASATLDQRLQQTVSDYLRSLADPEQARKAGLIGERLLRPDQLANVNYSFMLFERTAGGNRVRVQTDTTDQPLDINEGSKLELGSTAKLRVLATYLEIIAELHQRFAELPGEALRKIEVGRKDVLTRWALDYLGARVDRNLPAMLDAALERRYSASPGEAFFTGGGVHTFNNFRREDNGRNPTVREALQASINLPFVRLMRDVVRHTMYQVPGSTAKLLGDQSDERRSEYLARFADREGQVFLRRFWRKYQGLAPDAIRATLLDGLRPSAGRLAAAYRYLEPEAGLPAFAAFIRERLPAGRLDDKRVATLYRRYAPGNFDLPDQGYLARAHPLELWLAGYLAAHPGASFSEVVEASREERQAVYRWLFKTRAKSAQDQRIYTILEVEAFLDIHRRWARLGYPFHHLVPSLATALGSAGDRPAALAELMGIIINDGVRLPAVRIDGLHFAVGTPYETAFARPPAEGEPVMAPQVAAALRNALSEVVEGGTARRLAGTFKLADGSPVAVGGKTGTGDNRIVFGGRGGQARATIALNRTATFVFYLGPRHFGTLTAYVIGRDAADYRFTSGLPVQILKEMGPLLVPYLEAPVADLQAPLAALPVDAAQAAEPAHAAQAEPVDTAQAEPTAGLLEGAPTDPVAEPADAVADGPAAVSPVALPADAADAPPGAPPAAEKAALPQEAPSGK
jgi:membrane peptidoglycan carboxypeptidase